MSFDLVAPLRWRVRRIGRRTGIAARPQSRRRARRPAPGRPSVSRSGMKTGALSPR